MNGRCGTCKYGHYDKMELKNGSERMIRTYENSLSFNGAWSGKMKARAVVLNE